MVSCSRSRPSTLVLALHVLGMDAGTFRPPEACVVVFDVCVRLWARPDLCEASVAAIYTGNKLHAQVWLVVLSGEETTLKLSGKVSLQFQTHMKSFSQDPMEDPPTPVMHSH